MKNQGFMIHSVRFTAVLDTNVIYPVIIRDLLFLFAHYDLYTPKWSNHIFDEWKEVMERKGVSPEESNKRVPSFECSDEIITETKVTKEYQPITGKSKK
jgi:hypothetical protein